MITKPIKCIIVDDEPSAQAVLKHFISMIDFIDIKSLCFNAEEAEKALLKNQDINLIFLDINMPKVSGLNFYKSLSDPPEVILTTAYPQYALEAFDINAVDYLLKPIAFERFFAAVKKVFEKLKNLPTIANQSIVVNSNKVLHQIIINDILFVEAFGDYIKIHTTDKVVVVNNSLSNFLKELPSEQFARCHKSFVVNKNLINVVEGNTIHIEKLSIPIGLKYKAKFLANLKS